ncbi:MAG: dihydroorotase [Bdellovibrionales bacterium]|nr:dihydroorotase [Bdellovibrionales bacterium]
MTLIKNVHIIDPMNNLDGLGEVLIQDSLIKEVKLGGTIEASDVDIIDGQGKWLVPGLIDLHVHFREPGLEWKETIATGSRAAIMGGYTTVCCMPNTNPVNDSAEITQFILDKAARANLAKVLPIGAVSLSSKGKELAPLSEMHKAGCVAFSDDGEPIYDSGMMRRALEWCLMLDATISCHEEDKCLSCKGCMNESALSARLGLRGMPTIAEDVMVARDIELARFTGGKVHICHISSARGVELVRRAKQDGFRVTCEVTPHHLVLSENEVSGYDANFKMSPPLRGAEDIAGLIEGIKDGTIDAIASDHAPHEKDSKLVEFEEASMGILGLQTSLPLLLDFVKRGEISRKRFVELVSTGPARCFGLAQGSLSVGSPADMVLIDPDYEWEFNVHKNVSKSINSPFLGTTLTGIADTVLVDGCVKVLNRELVEQNKLNNVVGM